MLAQEATEIARFNRREAHYLSCFCVFSLAFFCREVFGDLALALMKVSSLPTTTTYKDAVPLKRSKCLFNSLFASVWHLIASKPKGEKKKKAIQSLVSSIESRFEVLH